MAIEIEDKLCDWEDCMLQGTYRAPKDRFVSQTKFHYYFCIHHIRIYNKNYNYYEGMSEQEITEDLKADQTWRRPTWQTGTPHPHEHSNKNDHTYSHTILLDDIFGVTPLKQEDIVSHAQDTCPFPPHSAEVRAMKSLRVIWPFDQKELKQSINYLQKNIILICRKMKKIN